MKTKLLRKLRKKANSLVDYDASYVDNYYSIYVKIADRERKTLRFGEFYQGMIDFVLDELKEVRRETVLILADEIRNKRKQLRKI